MWEHALDPVRPAAFQANTVGHWVKKAFDRIQPGHFQQLHIISTSRNCRQELV